MTPVLNNIHKVEFIEARFLKDIVVVPGKGVFLQVYRNFQKMDSVGLSAVTVATKVTKKNTIHSVNLKVLLRSSFEVGNRHLCYRLTTVMGEQYLLGTNVAPFPITTTSDNYPSVVTDKSGTTLTVTYSNLVGLLPILDK
ncbi:MAG: hypothetical protein IKC70_04340 [Bacteroidaceae bacterium]|nr:hypothetical protein [Bacteroidaceae bacterium]